MNDHSYHTEVLAADISAAGIKYEASYENHRNAVFNGLYKDIIREAYGVEDVICGHHLVYQTQETLVDPQTGPYTHTFVQEIPSADSLIFDTDVARKLWGEDWKTVLCILATTDIKDRDNVLSHLYYNRGKTNGS